MMVKGKAVEVEVVVAPVVGGRKLWLAIYHRENLIAVVTATVAMATVATVGIQVLVAVEEGLPMVSRQL